MSAKVSILIPTYNRPVFFEKALQSVLNQTFKNLEIVVCDDSSNNDTENLIKVYMEKHSEIIKYFRNNGTLGAIKNQQKCYELSTGEFINYLMDDDLFHPYKIEKMMEYFNKYDDVTMVTSHRQKIDKNGNPLPSDGAFIKLYPNDMVIDGIQMGDYILKNTINYIGEPTTVLFRKKELDEPFGMFCGIQAQNNVDVATWLNLMAKGKIVYISQTLSYCRFHESQLSRSPESTIKGLKDWYHHVQYAREKGFLMKKSDYIQALNLVKR